MGVVRCRHRTTPKKGSSVMENSKKKFHPGILILDTAGFSEELKQSFINQAKSIVEDNGIVLLPADGMIITPDGITKVNYSTDIKNRGY